MEENLVKQLSVNSINLSACEEVISKLSHIFTNKSRNYIGKKIDDVPELLDILNAINIVEKYCK